MGREKPATKRFLFYTTPIIIALSSIIFSFLILEICFRLFYPQELIRPMAAQIDSEIIYTLTPKTESYLKGTSTRMFHLKTNSLGLREEETPFKKPKGVFRILLLGDSVSMAEGVELEEIYLKRLGLLLKKRGFTNIETINAAIRGYGNDQELILFRRIAKKFNPDLVILGFFTGNDIEDNWNGQLFKIKGRQLLQQNASFKASAKFRFYSIQSKIQNIPGYSFLMGHSHFANFLRYKTAIILNNLLLKNKKEEVKQITIEETLGYDLTLAILKAWAKEVREIKALPLIIIIPTAEDVRLLRKGLDTAFAHKDLAIESFCRKEGIPFLNLTYNFMQWQGDIDSLWLDYLHFSPEGHSMVAEAIFNCLLSEKLLNPDLNPSINLESLR